MPLPYKDVWMLTLVDNKYRVHDDDLIEIRGDLPPEDLTETGERGIYARIGIPGRNRPKIQWVRGQENEMTFTAAFVNDGTVVGTERARGNAQRMRNILKRAARSIYDLARPPLFHFTYGAQPLALCFVREVSGIKYSTVLDKDLNSIMITVDVALEMLDDDIEAFALDQTYESVTPDKESAAIKVSEGDTWETIAAERYGDPVYGVAARQQSKVAFPGALVGQAVAERVVYLPPQSVLMRSGPHPRAVAMQVNRGDVKAAIDEVFAARVTTPSGS
jgi:hypothetical protein